MYIKENKRKVFLHVGFPKTGTSAIQKFLSLNKEKLLEQGILYPKTGITEFSGHANLFFSLKNNDGLFFNKFYKNLYKEIDNSDCSIIVISSEYFFSLNEEEILLLKKKLRNFDVKIVVYLRRIDERVESGYIQVIKDSNQRYNKNITDYIKFLKKNPQRIDYKYFCELWVNSFGKENLIVRVYEKEQMPNGIFFDFFTAIGVDTQTEWIVPDKKINQRLPKKYLKFLLTLNKHNISKIDHNYIVKVLNYMSKEQNLNAVPAQYSILRKNQREALIAEYEPSCRYVAENYLNRANGELFLYTNDYENKVNFYENELSIEETYKIFSEIIKTKNYLTNQNRKEIIKDYFNYIIKYKLLYLLKKYIRYGK